MSEAIIKYIKAPLSAETVKELRAGDVVRISGYIYTARDAAHKRLTEALARGEELPLDLKDNVIYYVGPSPAKPGEVVGSAGPNPCPPVTVGVGIGGNMEKAALLAKYSLSRKVGEHNPNPQYAELEKKLLELVNKTGVGPSGLGGSTTAVAVNIEYAPTHIGGMPVAVNLNCHAARRAEAEI